MGVKMVWKTKKIEPKYNIGDTFYIFMGVGNTIKDTKITDINGQTKELNVNEFVTIPCMSIINEISIKKKEISYTCIVYLLSGKEDGEIFKKIEIINEMEINENFFGTNKAVLDNFVETNSDNFDKLEREINKDKLKETLQSSAYSGINNK